MLEGKKVLVTGLTGRIGLAVATRFAPVCEMWGLARFTREGSWDEAVKLGVRPVRGDFARGSLEEVPTDFDYVLNIAANIYMTTVEEGMIDNSDGVARLMKHCRNARAFLQVSTTGVYQHHPDPYHLYREDDPIGSARGVYEPTKLAGEGAARGACIILDLPTVICRQNVQYGSPLAKGGLIDRNLDNFVATGEVPTPVGRPYVMAMIHDDDICNLIEPSLGLASIPATVVNWAGDEAVDWRELFEYVGQLIGKTPKFVPTPTFTTASCVPDPTRRKAAGGRLTLNWKEGVRRTLQVRHPNLILDPAS